MALWHIYLWPLCESCTVCTAYIFVTVKQSTYFSGYNKHDPLDLRPPHLVMTTNHPGPERAHRNPRATRAGTTGPSNMSTSSPSASPHLVSWRGVIYLNYNNSVTQWSPFFVGRFNTLCENSPTGTNGWEAGLWRDMPMLLTAYTLISYCTPSIILLAS